MNQLYTSVEHMSSPMPWANMPDLVPSYDDISTDPSPSPPLAYSSLNNHYQAFTNGATYPDYFSQQTRPQPSIANSIEFTDLTRIQAEDTHRRRRRSTTAQDKEAATNMRIRRRAQNRASQRAFRERKEKHVQHLEHELELLENKHQSLEKSYTEVNGAHARLQHEVEQLKEQLNRVRSSGSVSRESSVRADTPPTKRVLKMENSHKGGHDLFDPFASENNFY